MTEHNNQNGKPEKETEAQEAVAEDRQQEEHLIEREDPQFAGLLENPVFRERLFKAYRRIEREIQKRKDLKSSK